MAYQVGSGCYDSSLVATQVVAAQHVPVTSSGWVITVQSVADSAISYRYYDIAADTAYTSTHPVVLQPCNMLTQADALNVGWMIGGAWLSVYAITFLIRYLRGEMDSIDARDA